MEATKVCKKCGKEKPVSEFTKNKRMPDGIWVYCLECNRKMAKAYTEKNKEYSHNYYINNKEKIMENIYKYNEENAEKIINNLNFQSFDRLSNLIRFIYCLHFYFEQYQ